jgi:hypothetical protein
MHVIWKRPDGFHGADPADFVVVELGKHSKIWLHRSDHTHFPFRVAGGWQESESTKRLNNLVNLLPQPEAAWSKCLTKLFNDSMADDPEKFYDDLVTWLTELRSHLKGDTWEIDIMNQAVIEVQNRLVQTKNAFIKSTRS